ncbi:MAG TPA: hypothetical protein VFF81_01410 [Noviherbaspirillum sp.]|nr:hypothetical protein [Noviherbaspirillum sp.]
MNAPGEIQLARQAWNQCRYRPAAEEGHYESYFQRANHPSRPLAFWIRYTLFSPKGRPHNAVGELWAIYFDGETGRITAAKEVHPIKDCRVAESALDLSIGGASLDESSLQGQASANGHTLQWSLHYSSAQAPLLLLPRSLYESGFPKAKALVGAPNALFDGVITVDGTSIPIQQWQGSQNHNWGSKHTDSYAWGQVAGFDNAPDAFLECSTARLRIGPFWTPAMSLAVLRVDGREYALNSMRQALRAKGSFDFFDWHVESASAEANITVHIRAPRPGFVGLRYDNPPGGAKTCLNTKLARCDVTLALPGQAPRTLSTAHRAAFEILTERQDHGIAIVA